MSDSVPGSKQTPLPGSPVTPPKKAAPRSAWKPGQSGNPNGVKGTIPPVLKEMLREKSHIALQKLFDVIEAPWGTHETKDVIMCAKYVVDCVWAKPAAATPEVVSVAEDFLRQTLLRLNANEPAAPDGAAQPE